MMKLKLNRLSQKANHVTVKANQFLGQQIPSYIKSLPSIRNDAKRWALNTLYFMIGLLYNWAVSAVLRKIPNMQQFPPSVAGMVVLFFLLMCSHTIAPKITDRLVLYIDPYSSFALRSMNIMFVPAVVLIVNNPPTPGIEIGRMICVFIVGYIIAFALSTVLVRLIHILLFDILVRQKRATHQSNEKTQMHRNATLDEEAIQIDLPEGIHLHRHSPSIRQRRGSDVSITNTLNESVRSIPDISPCDTLHQPYQPKERHGPLHYIALWCMQQSSFDDLTLFLVFSLCAFVFLPLPEDNPVMPFFRLFLYLTMTVLCYSLCCRLPDKVRIVFHPIIVSAAFVMAGIAYFERVKGFDINHGVVLYKTGITFISLVEKTKVGWPGAGDVFSAMMDVSIISMAFNVYKSRPDSLREWTIVFMSVIPMAFLVMFVAPLFAKSVGCTPANSIVWSARSVTTAIGIVIGNVLEANTSTITCIIVFTGIMGPIFGPTLYKLLGVRDDDYMTIGITMGSTSHGVGTAYLITRNPKASGMSSLAFAIFGTLGVIIVSIPVFSETIKRLSGY